MEHTGLGRVEFFQHAGAEDFLLFFTNIVRFSGTIAINADTLSAFFFPSAVGGMRSG
jgi:hypothetical protein